LLDNVAGDDATDSDANPATGVTAPVVLGYGETNPTLDAGIHRPDSGLGDRVWEDLDHDGFQDVGEPGIPNVPVTLWQNGTPVGNTQTDASGYYSFTQLVPGTYSVTFGTPAGYLPTVQTGSIGDAGNSDANPSTGGTSDVTLPANTFNPNIDAGFWRPASLGDYVWEDFNHNGAQDEPLTDGVNGVLVTLLNDAGEIVSTTLTFTGGPNNAPGYYTFTNLISDTYYVSITLPSGYMFTLQDTSNEAGDSDVNTTTGATGMYVLNAGESIPTVDGGIWRPASLGDLVWIDIDHDGVQDLGEPGVPGVGVTLYDASNAVVSTTLTNSAGWYSFTNLISGTYRVQFDLNTLPAGYAPTLLGLNGASDPVDSDADATGSTELTQLVAGEHDPSWDMGIWAPAALGNKVWEDLNHDGVQDPNEPGVPGVLVTLTTPTGTLMTTTDASGNYTFTNLVSGTYQVQFTPPAGYTFTLPGVNPGGTSDADSNVNNPNGSTPPVTINIGQSNPTIDAGLWRPASLGDYVWHDVNHNGVQEPGEPPIAGAIVTLQTPTTTLQTTTDANGAYTFTNLISGAPYTVTFITPPDYQPTLTSGGVDDPANSDPNAAGQVVVTLAPGQHNPNIDAGFWQPATLGDYVWLDVDRDGVQDSGEPPVAGVVVTLLTPTGAVTATTSLTGFYQFVGLTPGTAYSISFGLPAGGYTWTVQDGGVDNPSNSDARPDGTVPAVTLTPGQRNPNIDAGVWIVPNVGLTKSTLNPGAARPGSTIRYQIVVRNAGPTLSRNVVLTDPIPADTAYVAGSATPAAQLIDGKLVWRIGDMAPGAVVTVEFTVKVNDNVQVSTIRNTAVLQTNERRVDVLSNEVQNPTSPTAVTLDAFEAVQTPNGVAVRWATALELNTLGYDLYRSETANRADAVKVNTTLIAAKGASGGAYAFVDANGTAQSRYWLIERELGGRENAYGPVTVTEAPAPSARTVVGVAAVAPVGEQRAAEVAGQGQSAVAGGQTAVAGSGAQPAQPVVVATAIAPVIVGPIAAAPAVVSAPVEPPSQPAVSSMPKADAVVVQQPSNGEVKAPIDAPNTTAASIESQRVKATSVERPAATQLPYMLMALIAGTLLMCGLFVLVGVGVAIRRRR
jgi:uncharacterized repeat protein (TIGR01451 family)